MSTTLASRASSTASRPPVTTVRVALAGCGTVGGALLDLLARHADDLTRRHALRFHVVRILARDASRPRSTAVERALLTTSVAEFLDTPADVVVEAIGGSCTADVLARGALAHGRALVTANKALLRTQGPALAAFGPRLRFEAAVGGGVPIVRLLREGLAGQGVHRVRAVLNGTTNYILSRIERGDPYAAALAAAQRAGFAEADPSRDLQGVDAADKLALLAWLAFGADPSTLEVVTEGLPRDVDAAVRGAARSGRRLRLVATAERAARGVTAHVSPALLHLDDPLAAAVDEENVIQVTSASSGTLTLRGRGAGGAATAAALLADLIHLFQPGTH
ncbi:MAG: homoserine dehydrogenase [Gemmatimonadetes bacterium]|nr:homoserine dehydrogenase [Gemmatimonadota bacterium]